MVCEEERWGKSDGIWQYPRYKLEYLEEQEQSVVLWISTKHMPSVRREEQFKKLMIKYRP